MKRKMKILFVILLGLGFMLFLASIFLVSQLPGPKEIGRIIKTNGQKQSNKISTEESKTIKKTVPNGHLRKEGEDEIGIRDDKSKEATPEQVITTLLESKNDLAVCENLQENTVFDSTKKDGEIKFSELFNSEYESDPMLSAIKYPLLKVFQDEKLSNLLNEIFEVKLLNPQKAEQDSILKKMNFYAKAAMTAVHLRTRKREFEKTADRAQHLRIFAQIAKIKPELVQDSDFLINCESIQRSILQEDEIDIKEERKNILNIIKRSGLTPKDLNFNPDSYTHFNLQSSKEGLTFNLSDAEIGADKK